MRRTHVIAGIALAVLLPITGCAEEDGGGGSGGDESGPVKLGAVLDITGAGASLGGPQRTTLQMLEEQINAEGGIEGRDVEVIIEDNQSTEEGAAQAANKLIAEDQVHVLIGASRSGPSLAMAPVAASAGVPMISLAASASIVEGEASDCVFKTAQNDQVVLERMVQYSGDQGWTTLGLARDASTFGEGVAETLDELGGAKGIEVATSEQFAPDATDFTAQMVNLRDAGADANIIWGIPPASGLAQKAYRQLGLEAPVMHSHGSGSSAFIETAGEAANGALVTVGRIQVADQLPQDDPQAEVITQFVKDYQEASDGERPSPFAGYSYDAFQLATSAIAEVGTGDSQAICDHLENVEGHVGVSGVFNMTPEDHSGLGPEAIVVATVENGEFQVVDATR